VLNLLMEFSDTVADCVRDRLVDLRLLLAAVVEVGLLGIRGLLID